jgi:class 3 adenylate cyclase
MAKNDNAKEPAGAGRELEMAHILFMDIVSYSVLPTDHQPVIVSELQQIVQAIPSVVQAQTNENLICLPSGDGMALVFFGDPTLPARSAQQLAVKLRERRHLRLRMGIHSGLVYRVSDINARENIAGAGINFAQRVMDCGDAGHILISKTVAEMLLHLSDWKDFLHDLGEVEVKNKVRLHVFNMFSPTFGNEEIPQKMRSTKGPGATIATGVAALSFDPWTPVIPPVFVGRAGVLARLQGALDEGRSVSLVGDWRIGKSSVLRTYWTKLQTSGRSAKLLNGGDREGASPEEFVECAIGKKAGNSPDSAADALSGWAQQNQKPGLHPVLVIDEFDKLIVRFDHRFFERLRGMLDYLSLIVSSRRELDRVYQDLGRTSPFHNRLELCWVGLLEHDAAEELANRSSPALSSEMLEMVREWAGRHPFFIQLLGRKVTDSLRYGESLEEAKEQFLAEGSSRLRELWATLQTKDQDLLRESARTPQPQAKGLRRRGLLTEEGRPFGRLLVEWLQNESI